MDLLATVSSPINMHMHVSEAPLCSSFSYIPKNESAGSHRNSVFDFLKNPQTVCRSG